MPVVLLIGCVRLVHWMCFTAAVWDVINIPFPLVCLELQCNRERSCLVASVCIWNNQRRAEWWAAYKRTEKRKTCGYDEVGKWNMSVRCTVYDCLPLILCQFCALPLPVMHRNRGNMVVSQAELIDLTTPLCTAAKMDFSGCYATVSVEHNSKLPCGHLLSATLLIS